MSSCLDNKGEFGADQDVVPELKEYINSASSQGDNEEHEDGGRITAEMKISISRKKTEIKCHNKDEEEIDNFHSRILKLQ